MSNCQKFPTVSKIRQETNNRIYDRNLPSQMLQPYIDVRPVMTKYSFLPIVDARKQVNVPLQQQPNFNTQQVFNPGNTQSPWSGFASNVNKESELRNQIYALQKCSQAVYVPSSKSDLYNYSFTPNRVEEQHDLLFKEYNFCEFNPNPETKVVGSSLFMNNTRVQVRDLTKQP